MCRAPHPTRAAYEPESYSQPTTPLSAGFVTNEPSVCRLYDRSGSEGISVETYALMFRSVRAVSSVLQWAELPVLHQASIWFFLLFESSSQSISNYISKP
jgi:hypothetical protein